MRPDDFFRDDLSGRRRFNASLARSLRGGPIEQADDVEAAVALARLVHDDLEAFGTGGGEQMDEAEMREALLCLRAVVDRIGIDEFDLPFRDYGTFKSYWLRNDGYGSWQARRDLLGGIFDGLHDELAVLESRALSSALVEAVSPRGRTGWAKIDAEIAELRRHFQRARSPQDYRNVGNDCVIVTEALSRQLYDPGVHLRPGEEEPPIGKTKLRLGRFVENAAAGSEDAALRKLVKASIEFAQEVKHRDAPSRREAGIAADSVILLANLLRRIDEP
jgi:hypothetical protein